MSSVTGNLDVSLGIRPRIREGYLRRNRSESNVSECREIHAQVHLIFMHNS